MSRRLLNQIKQRRKALKLTQKDMQARIGISRQQYQHIESKGNPRLDTLELVAAGLDSELVLIPKEKMIEVVTLLNDKSAQLIVRTKLSNEGDISEHNDLTDNPWKGLLNTQDGNHGHNQ